MALDAVGEVEALHAQSVVGTVRVCGMRSRRPTLTSLSRLPRGRLPGA